MFPPFVIAPFALALVILSFSRKSKLSIPLIALAGLLLTLLVVVYQFFFAPYSFYKIYVVDSFSLLFDMIFLSVSIMVVINSLNRDNAGFTYYAAILLANAGMMSVAHSVDFVSLFIGLELTSISFYPLILSKKDQNGTEAATKFFIVSIFSAGAMLFGISLLYGATGSSSFYSINPSSMSPLLISAIAFIAASFAFKIGAFPFNLWVPDVYEGSPSGITAMLASASKKAGFAALFRFFLVSLPLLKFYWIWAFALISFATMSLGNLIALAQKNVKRMLAYSTIGQVGYILIAMSVPAQLGLAAGLLQIVTHAIGIALAFIIVSVLESQGISNLEDYSGVGSKYPLIGAGMLISFASLVGIPPLAGFFSKFYLLSAAVSGGFWWLAVSMIVYSIVSVYFYFRVLSRMFAERAKSNVIIPVRSIIPIILCILFLAGFVAFAQPIFSTLISTAASIVK